MSKNELPIQFSGGELQRIAIARALLKKCDIYVFDESFGNIDEKTREVVIDNIVNYLDKKIIIIITHDKRNFEKYNTNLVCI